MLTGSETLCNSVISNSFARTVAGESVAAARTDENCDATGIVGSWNDRSAGCSTTGDFRFGTNTTPISSRDSSHSPAY